MVRRPYAVRLVAYRFTLSPSLSLSFPFLALFRSAAPHLSPPPLPCLESVYITCILSTRASPLRLRCLVVSNMRIDLAPSRRVSAISVLPSLELPLSTASMASWTMLAPQSLVPRSSTRRSVNQGRHPGGHGSEVPCTSAPDPLLPIVIQPRPSQILSGCRPRTQRRRSTPDIKWRWRPRG